MKNENQKRDFPNLPIKSSRKVDKIEEYNWMDHFLFAYIWWFGRQFSFDQFGKSRLRLQFFDLKLYEHDVQYIYPDKYRKSNSEIKKKNEWMVELNGVIEW